MTERPILFSGPMVRPVLTGDKTQTRRVAKGAALEWLDQAGFTPEFVADPANHLCPYGQPGDRLWVRETWGYRCSSGTDTAGQYLHTVAYRADDARHTFGPMPMDGVSLPKWRERDPGMSWDDWNDRMTAYWQQWRPSIHMPRWASRITLEVTGVRVERLQDISEDDAVAEGVVELPMAALPPKSLWAAHATAGCELHARSASGAYAKLWESINCSGSWDLNPWVWVISFQKVTP